MERIIICPNCDRTISNDPLIEAAANEENLGASFLTCECGERISFWAISAQLRDQKTIGWKIRRLFARKSKK